MFVIDSITGGNGSENYFWTESNSISNWCFELQIGQGYEIIIIDTIFGCSDTLMIDTIQANFEISVSETINDVLCYGEASGSINIDTTFGGNIPYTYTWGGFGQGPFIDSLFAGNYFLEIEDSIGCKQTFYFDVDQNNSINVNPNLTLPSCNGLSDGVIHVNVNGGQSPYSLNWSNGTGTSDSLFGLPTGSYTLNVIDDNLCEYSTTYTLSQPDSLLLYFDNYSNPT